MVRVWGLGLGLTASWGLSFRCWVESFGAKRAGSGIHRLGLEVYGVLCRI